MGSSSGSGSAVAANLVTCGIGEETGTSIRGPACYNNLVGIAATQELVSRHGMIDAGINTRCGPICRTVTDAAKVLSVIAGWDPKDELTAFSAGRTPARRYESFCHTATRPGDSTAKPLNGLRVGVLREYMEPSVFGLVDQENLKLVDVAVTTLGSLGAVLVEPEPGSTGLLTPTLRRLWPLLMNSAFARSSEGKPLLNPSFGQPRQDQISALLALGADPSLLPDDFSIRSISNVNAPGEGTLSLEKYLRERGDAVVRTTADLISHARFFKDDRYFDPKAGLERRLEATELDTGPRMRLRFAVQQVVLCAMAELELDVLVAPTNNQPPPKLGAPRPLGRDARPDVWSFLGSQGIPNITVPAGWTTHVFDRVRDPSVDPASFFSDPPAVGADSTYRGKGPQEGYRLERVEAVLPLGLDIMGRPFAEPRMLQVASVFEAATQHRRPPAAFGAL